MKTAVAGGSNRLAPAEKRRAFFLVLAGCCATALMLFLYVIQPSLLVRLDLKIYDLFLPLRAAPEPSRVPAIVDLDEASLAVYGQWPWPRYIMADLLDALTDYGVAAIGLDIMFAEPDRSSPAQMQKTLRRDKGMAPSFSDIPKEWHDYDVVLSRALARSPAIVGAYANYENGGSEKSDKAEKSAPIPPPALIERELPGAIPWQPLLPNAGRAVLPLPALRDAAPVGFINAAPDQDGIMRKIPLLVKVEEIVYPTLALRVLMKGLGRAPTLVSGPYGLEAIRLRAGNERLEIPVTPQGMMHLPFIGPRKTYPYYSAADILARRIDPKALQNRVVFVGTSVAGLSDFRATPFDASCPGVEIHAAAVDTLLTGNAIVLPPYLPAAQIAGILLAGIFSTAAFGFARPRMYLPAALGLLLAAIFLSRHLFASGLFISPLYSALTVAVCGSPLMLARFWLEERQKRRLRRIFSRYVAPEVVNRIARTGEALFAGEEKTLSILFSDIRGFTSLSETLKPREVVNLLNRYFGAMTRIVRQGGGTLDKFIGDALMAYWNAPLDTPDHPRRAVTAALEMQAALLVLNLGLKTELDIEIHIGVGIHTGTVFVGNMGSEDLISYTPIGDNVNLASRLEGLCPYYGVNIIVSEETRHGCGESFAYQPLDTIRVKGKQQPVSIFCPLRHEEAAGRSAELARWEEARALYIAGDFIRADRRLAALCKDFPETKLYAVFADRVIRLLKKPFVAWNGVWTLTTK